MSIASQFNQLITLKNNVKAKILSRGGTVGGEGGVASKAGLATFSYDIDTIPNIWKAMADERNKNVDGWKYAFWEFPYSVFIAATNTDKDAGGNTLKTKVSITQTNLQYTFYQFAVALNTNPIAAIDLSDYFDFSEIAAGSNFYKCFQGAKVSKIPYIDLSGCDEAKTSNMFSSTSISDIFIKISGGTKFGTINSSGSTNSPFYNATGLTSVKIAASSDIRTSINLESSNPNLASFTHTQTLSENYVGIIDALHDFSLEGEIKASGEGVLTLTSNTYNYTLNSTEREAIYNKGWTVSVI